MAGAAAGLFSATLLSDPRRPIDLRVQYAVMPTRITSWQERRGLSSSTYHWGDGRWIEYQMAALRPTPCLGPTNSTGLAAKHGWLLRYVSSVLVCRGTCIRPLAPVFPTPFVDTSPRRHSCPPLTMPTFLLSGLRPCRSLAPSRHASRRYRLLGPVHTPAPDPFIYPPPRALSCIRLSGRYFLQPPYELIR